MTTVRDCSTVISLRQECRRRLLHGYYKFNKAELIQFLNAHPAAPATSTTQVAPTVSPTPKPAVVTEDLGKTLEYALCLALGCATPPNFKYSLARATALAARLQPLATHLTARYGAYQYVGNSNHEHDFVQVVNTGVGSDNRFALSVKSVKQLAHCKICPQVIGQTTCRKFCARFHISDASESTTPATDPRGAIKQFIAQNLHRCISEYTRTTFHCLLVLYVEDTDDLMLIQLAPGTRWDAAPHLNFSLSRAGTAWHESSTLYARRQGTTTAQQVAIGEFQIHNHRDTVKFRFDMQKILQMFANYFIVARFDGTPMGSQAPEVEPNEGE
jgi:hypothetical protein